jgi:hypothetical protein
MDAANLPASKHEALCIYGLLKQEEEAGPESDSPDAAARSFKFWNCPTRSHRQLIDRLLDEIRG